MQNLQFIEELSSRGIGIEVSGDRLLIHAARGAVTDQDRARLRQNRRAILEAFAMPPESELIAICRRETAGTDLAPRELARWLIRQRDPGWCHPLAVRRWVRYATENAGLPL